MSSSRSFILDSYDVCPLGYHLHFVRRILSTVVPVYNAEVAPKNLRGRLVSLNQLAITAGIMASYCTVHDCREHLVYCNTELHRNRVVYELNRGIIIWYHP